MKFVYLSKNLKARDIILILLTACSLILVFSFPPVAQNPSFHNFVDQRQFFGIANFYNVVTNLPFVIVGGAGLIYFRPGDSRNHSVTHTVLFVSVIAIGFGSAWYHYDPGNASLVWDRIPMTLTFMSYFSLIVARHVNERLGSLMLIPSLILGIFSVCYWYITEQSGNGDLRLYMWVQFYPMLAIPLIIFLYPARRSVRVKIIAVIAVYVLAKLAEQADGLIYDFHNLISGHSLKHLLASLSVLLILSTTAKNASVRKSSEATTPQSFSEYHPRSRGS
jgi:hypothetical protein